MDISTLDNISVNLGESKTMSVALSVGSFGSNHTHENKDILDSITQDKIDSWEGASVDLTLYQLQQDSNLSTNSKTIVGAINENKSSLDSMENELNDHIANHPSGGGKYIVTSNIKYTPIYSNDFSILPTVTKIGSSTPTLQVINNKLIQSANTKDTPYYFYLNTMPTVQGNKNVEINVDIMVRNDLSVKKHVGLLLQREIYSTTVLDGLRLTTLNEDFILSVFSMGNESGYGGKRVVNTVYTNMNLKIRVCGAYVEVYINNVYEVSFPVSIREDYKVGFFTFGCVAEFSNFTVNEFTFEESITI